MASLRVAVAGPNSALAPSVLRHLSQAGFSVTILTRDATKTKLDPSSAVLEANYSSADSLAPSLKDQDAVVDLLNDRTMAASITLVDAAIAAGVQHIIPGSFGLNFQNAFMRSVPLVQGKVKLEDHVLAKAEQGKISYTIIETGMFLDWALSKGRVLPLEGGVVEVFDGGEAKQSLSLLEDIGRAVAAALLRRDDPAVKNKILFMHSVAASPKEVVELAQQAANGSKTWELRSEDAEAAYERGKKAFAEGQRDPSVFRGFAAGYVKAGSDLFKRVDNEILGVKSMSDEELRDVVAAFTKSGSAVALPYLRAQN